MGGRTRTNPCGIQGVPLTPRLQHKQDCVETAAVPCAGTAPAKNVRVLVLGQQSLDLRPELIGRPPTIVRNSRGHLWPPLSLAVLPQDLSASTGYSDRPLGPCPLISLLLKWPDRAPAHNLPP